MSEDKDYCSNCGKELTADERPCSNCGSTKKTVCIFRPIIVQPRTSLRGEVEDQTGKTKNKFYVRSKISKQGREAKEELTIDIAGNRKIHHVSEQDKNGCWAVVHHEDEPLKKKQRK